MGIGISERLILINLPLLALSAQIQAQSQRDEYKKDDKEPIY